MRTLFTIVHAPTAWRILIAVLVIGARFALDGLMPRGRVASRARRRFALIAAATLAVAAQRPGAARAQAAQAPPAAADTSKIDQDAMGALNKMGAYLRTLKALQVRATVTTEEVLLDGQKVQLASVAELVAEKPNRLRLEITSDRQHRLFFYDGTTFTLFAPAPGFYASVPAPPTIGELAHRLEDKYGIDMPFVDLFRWGTSESNADDITAATDIGPSVIDGVTCEHYAFRQSGLDWQIWIQNGDYPLPRKLVLTTLTDEARPQHVALYTWNLAPSVNATAYAFTPPPDAKKISIAEIPVARKATKAQEPHK